MCTDRRAGRRRLQPQPLVGLGTAGLALLALTAAWLGPAARPSGTESVLVTLLALGLVGATVATYQFPIHLRHHTKVQMTSVPYYLLAVLMPPPLAALAAGVGALSGELSVRAQRGSQASDIATEVGRRVLVVFLGALVAHLPWPVALHAVALVGAAVVLGGGDIVTFPLVLARVCDDRPWRVLVAAAREAYLLEGAQYLLGLLGAVAAVQEVWTLVVLAVPTALVYAACKRATEMQNSTRQLLESMADTVDLRDPYTGGHSRRVTEFCVGILRELQVQGPEAALIVAAARVHDIGKIAIPDAVLNKPGPLTPEERAVMESHAERGAAVLRRYPDFARGVGMVLHHHESWDGTGYPHRLKGPEIPFGARVIAVADSFDAMTSDRPYRRGMPVHKAAQILREGRGRQWDGIVVDALLRSIADQLERPATPVLHLVRDSEPGVELAAPTGTA